MTRPTIVLIHGGQHTKVCWEPTIEAIRARDPAASVLAVNIPGHGGEPGDLANLTIAQCEDSVTAQILALQPERVVLVAHSMAGITVPGVARQLGAAVVQRIIFLACCVPPEGKSVVDTLHPPMNAIAKMAAKSAAVSPPLTPSIAHWLFANGMTREQRQHVDRSMSAESTRVTIEPVNRSGFPVVPMSWILPLRDRALRPKVQHQFIANLGGVDEVLELDTCHDAMISEPVKLADMILTASGWD